MVSILSIVQNVVILLLICNSIETIFIHDNFTMDTIDNIDSPIDIPTIAALSIVAY